MIGLAASVGAPAPMFRARFVPFSAGVRTPGARDQIVIADARRDGAAVGTTFYTMTNSYPTRPLYVFGWHQVPTGAQRDEIPDLYPVAILGRRRVVVANGPWRRAKGADGEYRAAVLTGGGLRVEPRPLPPGVAPAPHLALPEGTYQEGGLQSIVPEERLLPTRYQRRRNTLERVLGRVASRWWPVRPGVAIGEMSFREPAGDTPDVDSFGWNQDHVGLLAIRGLVRPLRDYVAGGVELNQMAWASPEGWFVYGAQKGGTSGLAWLTPMLGR